MADLRESADSGGLQALMGKDHLAVVQQEAQQRADAESRDIEAAQVCASCEPHEIVRRPPLLEAVQHG
jgi:hypothetical protein